MAAVSLHEPMGHADGDSLPTNLQFVGLALFEMITSTVPGLSNNLIGGTV